MATVLRRIDNAVATRAPFFISTPNLNFLITSQSDAEFRASLQLSDVCTADGMPLVWIAKLLGIPIRGRLAGADLFEALKDSKDVDPLKVFLFGGADGVAASACDRINSHGCGLTCAGSYYPGFTPVDDMSTDEVMEAVNASKADILVAALGAKKGQSWLLRNHDRIRIPVRAHLGATIGFQAGSVKRAPVFMQKLGLEWLWRIKEEPQLWQRYWRDGWAFLRLMLTRVLPLLVISRRAQRRWGAKPRDLIINRLDDQKTVILTLEGFATGETIGKAIAAFENVLREKKDVVINFSNIGLIDARFLGLLGVLDKRLGRERLRLSFVEIPPPIKRILRLSGFEFLQRH
jgi:N-acetylglucosaminyldiphosphoundecaprenol N-acetyl-beta-D-mannosaminyltransferase